MTLHPQLVNNFSKIIFTPKYVDSRALSSIVASQIYTLFVVKSTSVPKLWGGGKGVRANFGKAKILRPPFMEIPPLWTHLSNLTHLTHHHDQPHNENRTYSSESA